MNVGIKIVIANPLGNQILQIQVPVVSPMLSREQYLQNYAQVLGGLSQQMFVNGLAATIPILLEQNPESRLQQVRLQQQKQQGVVVSPEACSPVPEASSLLLILDMVQMNTHPGSALPDVFKTHKNNPWLKTKGEIRKVDEVDVQVSSWRRFASTEIIETRQGDLVGWDKLYPELFGLQEEEEPEPQDGEENSDNDKPKESLIQKP